MSTWRKNEEPTVEFCDQIYCGEEVTIDEKKEDTSDEDSELDEEDASERRDETLHPSPSSSVRLPSEDKPGPSGAAPPLEFEVSLKYVPAPDGVVLRNFDEKGTPLDDDDENAVLPPNTKRLHQSLEELDVHECAPKRRKIRRKTGVKGVKERSADGGPKRGGKKRNQWMLGDPLNEMWTSDEHLPPEVVSLAMDAVKKQEKRLKDATKVVRTRERDENKDSEHEDGFLDDGVDTLPKLEDHHLRFKWCTMDTFKGKEEMFKPDRTGSVRTFNTAYDAFRSYWSDDVLALIAAQTNVYATKIASASFQSEWYPTNYHEILCLFAFWMMLAIIRMPTVTSCFSLDPLLKTEIYRRIFTRRRYELLTRALHFVEPVTNNSDSSNTSANKSDLLHRLRPIITHLNSAFQSNYILSKEICIDESLTPWKGRKLKFKQYIRTKAAKLGIKTLELCESTTGYLWSFIVYTGKQSPTDPEQPLGVLKSTTLVLKLMSPLLNKGYRLFMDNWFNSPLLARVLKLNGTDCVGTLRYSRRDVPVVINKAPLKRGEYIARHSGDVTMLSWQDRKRITMISTCHGSSTAMSTVPSRPPYLPVLFKPHMVLDHNKFMGGVDMKDQLLEPYLLERKRCSKWYMKLFKRLLNVSILNSRILLQSSTKKNQDHLAFRLQVVDSILSNHLLHCPKSRKFTMSMTSTHEQPGRYINSTHWPVLLEATKSSSSRNRNFWKRCFFCRSEGRPEQKTPYCCESCRVPLCIRDCFKAYHTKSNPI